MDENSTKDCNSSSQIYPFLRGHQLSSYTGSGGGTVGGAAPHRASSLPSSAYDLAGTQLPILACSDGEDASLSQGFGSDSLVHVQRGEPSEADLDGYDCESKEGVEVAEGPVKPAAHRSSGSKRSRAAEVHNLSEKRRRSRINEKMKALQKLIPNSNKTDKASMLDEAIDYLKQLQLQVQMLSMRNGLTLHPTYISGAMQPLQSSQIRLPFGADNPSSLTNLGMGMLPVGLDSSNPNSFNLPNHVTASHQPLVPGVSNINEPVSSYGMETSDPRHGFFHLPGIPSEGAYTEDMVSHRLNQAESMRPGAEINSLAATPPLPFNGRPHLLEANHLDSQILNQGGSRENLSKDQDTQTHIQHLHG